MRPVGIIFFLRREDGEELAKKLPLIQDPDLISVLLDELSPPTNPNQTQEGQDKGSGLRALCQLSLGLALAALKRAPQSLLRGSNTGEIKSELLDQDEVLIDAAIDGKVSQLMLVFPFWLLFATPFLNEPTDFNC